VPKASTKLVSRKRKYNLFKTTAHGNLQKHIHEVVS
jgi:hypothetical protein